MAQKIKVTMRRNRFRPVNCVKIGYTLWDETNAPFPQYIYQTAFCLIISDKQIPE